MNSFKNPFNSEDSRYKSILAFTPVIFILFLVYWGVHSLLRMNTLKEEPICGEFRFDLMLAPGEIILHIAFSIYALFSIIVAARGLLRKGLNQDIK
jgi:ABC-type arginine transport system permease subunit